MEKNRKVLEEWENEISKYQKLKFEDAKKMYIEFTKCKEKQIREELITRTLYVVCNFIKNSGLLYMNSYYYDMSDIIGACNEIWIKKIDEGMLLQKETFNKIFDPDFYSEICKSLNITSDVNSETYICNLKLFIELLVYYKKEKEKNDKYDYYELTKYIENNPIYHSFYQLFYFYYDEKYNISYFEFIDKIIDSFELEDEDLKISTSKLYKMRNIVINNGMEYYRSDINDITVDSFEKEMDIQYLREELIKALGTLEKRNAQVISERYGIYDGEAKDVKFLAKKFRVTSGRIRQIEAKTLRRLRHPSRARFLIDFL